MMTLWQELTGAWQPAILLMLSAHLVVAGVMTCARPTDRPANLMLGLLLFTIAGIVFRQVLLLTDLFEESAGWAFLPIANDLALAPLILGYVFFLTSGRLPLPRLILFAPPVAYIFYMLVVLVMPEPLRRDWLETGHRALAIPTMTAVSLPATVLAVGFCGWRLRTYRAWLASHSSAKADFEIRGLHLALLAIAAPVVAWVVSSLRLVAVGPATPETEYPFYLMLALCGYVLALIGITQPPLEFPKMTDRADDTHAPEPHTVDPVILARPPLKAAPLPSTAVERLMETSALIRERIIEEVWYTEPRLALADVARRTGLSEAAVSQALNQGLQTNFNRFINEIRVEAIKKSLEAGSSDILGLALDNGFNSKATFNRVFKEITGLTPSTYRSQNSTDLADGEKKPKKL